MPRREEVPSTKTIDDLKELIAAERAKLRWRVETRTPDEQGGRPRKTGTGRLYRVFRACTNVLPNLSSSGCNRPRKHRLRFAGERWVLGVIGAIIATVVSGARGGSLQKSDAS